MQLEQRPSVRRAVHLPWVRSGPSAGIRPFDHAFDGDDRPHAAGSGRVVNRRDS